MKKHFLIKCLPLLCPFFGQQLAAQTLNIQPAKVLQGSQVTLHYQPKGGDLEFSDEPKAQIAVYGGGRWKSNPVSLKKENDEWTANIQVPANAALMAVKFYQGDVMNPEASDTRGGKGYFYKVLNAKGKEVTGTYLAEAAFITGQTGDWTLNNFVKPEKNKQTVDSLLVCEEKLSGKSLRAYLFTYLDLKKSVMPVAEFEKFADGLMKAEVKKGNLSEEFLAGLQRYYSRLKMQNEADQIQDIVLKNYPKSGTAMFLSFKKATDNKTGKDFQDGAENFLKQFPYTEWKKNPDNKGFLYYELFRGLASWYFESGQQDKFLSLFKDIDFKTANEIYRWNITKGQMMGTVDRKMLYGFSKVIIPYLIERQKDQSYMIDFGNDQQKAQQNADDQLDDRLFTHIFLANNQEDYAGGNGFFKYLSKKGAYGNADLNALHLNILEKLNDKARIKPLLEASVADNAVTPEMFVKLKEIYLSEHNGKDEGYEKYLSALIPNDKKAEMRAHVMANMVNYPLVPFSLENADGNMVNSKDWADKIVVIDFWATWCRPCIMAFPGMQLLVDQYAKDPKVGIYMIGTMQFGDYKTKSVNYVRGEGYRFNLLHDAVGPKGEQDQVFKSLVPLFKSSAIPRKIIVKNGTVRYSSEGYSGSPSQLRDELSMAVEILRAEK